MIDMHPPPAYVQIAQKQTPGASQPLQLVPSQPPQPAVAPPPPPPTPAPDQIQPPPPGDIQPERIEVTPLDVGRYLPPTATYATIIVTVVPPTGTVEIYVPPAAAALTAPTAPPAPAETAPPTPGTPPPPAQ